ncbi:hypothetical protein V8C86DRAFT_3030416 [Haematococcus lacustris]
MAFRMLKALSILLTSGTLSPLDSFAHELQLSFDIRLENPHIIHPSQHCLTMFLPCHHGQDLRTLPPPLSPPLPTPCPTPSTLRASPPCPCPWLRLRFQVWVGVMGSGPSGYPLCSNYQSREDVKYKDDLGNAVVNFARLVPDGLLVFFPSYGVLNSCLEHWKVPGAGGGARGGRAAGGGLSAWERIVRHKAPVVEPRDSGVFQQLLASLTATGSLSGCAMLSNAGAQAIDEFKNKLDDPATTGAVFFAVCRGKDSSPPPAVLSKPAGWCEVQVRLKREVLDEALRGPAATRGPGLTGEAWYVQQAMRAVNQAMGRVIRHRWDYGAVLLVDKRFGEPSTVKQMSKWLQNHVVQHANFGAATCSLTRFFKEKADFRAPPGWGGKSSKPAAGSAFQAIGTGTGVGSTADNRTRDRSHPYAGKSLMELAPAAMDVSGLGAMAGAFGSAHASGAGAPVGKVAARDPAVSAAGGVMSPPRGHVGKKGEGSSLLGMLAEQQAAAAAPRQPAATSTALGGLGGAEALPPVLLPGPSGGLGVGEVQRRALGGLEASQPGVPGVPGVPGGGGGGEESSAWLAAASRLDALLMAEFLQQLKLELAPELYGAVKQLLATYKSGQNTQQLMEGLVVLLKGSATRHLLAGFVSLLPKSERPKFSQMVSAQAATSALAPATSRQGVAVEAGKAAAAAALATKPAGRAGVQAAALPTRPASSVVVQPWPTTTQPQVALSAKRPASAEPLRPAQPKGQSVLAPARAAPCKVGAVCTAQETGAKKPRPNGAGGAGASPCCLCKRSPMEVPFAAPCGHKACFTCWQAQLAQHFKCGVCSKQLRRNQLVKLHFE